MLIATALARKWEHFRLLKLFTVQCNLDGTLFNRFCNGIFHLQGLDFQKSLLLVSMYLFSGTHVSVLTFYFYKMLSENYRRYLKGSEYFSARTLISVISELIVPVFRSLISYFFDEVRFSGSKFPN